MTCAEAKLLIEKRLHGALPADEAAPLEQHLAGCEACRRFEAAARRTEAAMQEAVASAERRIDWERIRAGIARGRRGYRIEQWIAPAVALVAFVPVAVRRSPPQLWALVAVATLPLCWLMYVQARARVRAVLEAQRSDAASLAWMRAELDQRIRARKQVLYLHVVLPSVIAVALLFEQLPPAGIARIGFLVIIAVALADGAFGLLVDLPRLQRERAELE